MWHYRYRLDDTSLDPILLISIGLSF